MKKVSPNIGTRIGRLVLLKEMVITADDLKRANLVPSSHVVSVLLRFWECRCDCGNTFLARQYDIADGSAQSCGCGLANNGGAKKTKRPCASRFKGVTFHPGNRKMWKAKIKKNRVTIHLGYFEREETAARAYDVAAAKLFGDCAMTNERLGLFRNNKQSGNYIRDIGRERSDLSRDRAALEVGRG